MEKYQFKKLILNVFIFKKFGINYLQLSMNAGLLF